MLGVQRPAGGHAQEADDQELLEHGGAELRNCETGEQVEQSLVTLLDGSGVLTGQVCACLGAGGERESGWGLDCRSD